MSASRQTDVEHAYADLGDVRLHYAHSGDGPLIVFLHGFPQCWYTFRHQLADFGRDHRALAPDLRGCNLSSTPERPHEYGSWLAAQDIRTLVQRLGREFLTQASARGDAELAVACGPIGDRIAHEPRVVPHRYVTNRGEHP